jgi:hypothetical protein
MRSTVVSPNCFGTMVDTVATVFPAIATSLRRKVAASYHFGKILVGGH